MFHTVLVAIDIEDRESWTKILEQGLICADPEEGKFRLLYVRPDFSSALHSFATDEVEREEQERCEQSLGEIARSVNFPQDRVSWVVRKGSVYDQTLNEADACLAKLIVVGPHRSSVSGFLLGSSASIILRHAPVSVLVVR